jgi:hypothetical protein
MMTCGLGLGALYFEMNLVKYCYLPGEISRTAHLLSQLKHSQAVMLSNQLSLVMEDHYCAALFSEITASNSSKSAILGIVKDIKGVCRSFPNVKFRKINRSANRIAHELAILGRNVLSKQVLLDSFPSCLLELIERECNNNNSSCVI